MDLQICSSCPLSLTYCAFYLKQALLSLPRLQRLYCEGLSLADWQYAEYKYRYRDSIQIAAHMTERKILQRHNTLDHENFVLDTSTHRDTEALFLRYRELLAAPGHPLDQLPGQEILAVREFLTSGTTCSLFPKPSTSGLAERMYQEYRSRRAALEASEQKDVVSSQSCGTSAVDSYT